MADAKHVTVTYSENEKDKFVSLSAVKEVETEQLSFYSDDEGFSIVSSVVEKYGDQPIYLNIRLDNEKFKQLLKQLHRLVGD